MVNNIHSWLYFDFCGKLKMLLLWFLCLVVDKCLSDIRTYISPTKEMTFAIIVSIGLLMPFLVPGFQCDCGLPSDNAQPTFLSLVLSLWISQQPGSIGHDAFELRGGAEDLSRLNC